MSFLLLRGKMYHCTDCDLVVPTEYEGGPMLTQVGITHVLIQMQLNKEHMPPSYDPEKEGYYFHTNVLCGDCLKTHLNNQTIVYNSGNNPPFAEIFYIMDTIYEEAEELLEEIAIQYASKLNAAYCRNLDPEHFERTLGHKYFKLTNKKPILADEYVKLAQRNIVKDFKQYLGSLDEMEKHLGVYRKALSKYEAVLKTIIDEGKEQYYLQVKFGEKENLNPYICHDLTVRTQIKPDEEYDLYEGPYTILRDKIDYYLKTGPFDQLSEVHLKLFEEVKKSIVRG